MVTKDEDSVNEGFVTAQIAELTSILENALRPSVNAFSSRLDELENCVAAVEHNGDSNQDETSENASPETDVKGAELAKLRTAGAWCNLC